MLRILLISCAIFLFISESSAKPTQQLYNFSKDFADPFKAVVQKCATTDGRKMDVADILKTLREGTYREDDDYKNMIYCTYTNTGLNNSDGSVQLEKCASIYPDPKAMLKVLKACDKIRGKTPADNSFLFFKCFQDTSPVLMGIYP